MNIKINGNVEIVKAAPNLHEFILSRGLCSEKIVVEHNFVITAKEKWPHTPLQENDTIEIISFVGGG